MYQNAGLTSVFYPIMAFGFGMLEEVGPSRTFWDVVRAYTVCLLIYKFILNIEYLFDDWVRGTDGDEGARDVPATEDTVARIAQTLKIGLYHHETIGEICAFMMPEILIITFLTLHEIKRKLLGVYYEHEL